MRTFWGLVIGRYDPCAIAKVRKVIRNVLPDDLLILVPLNIDAIKRLCLAKESLLHHLAIPNTANHEIVGAMG